MSEQQGQCAQQGPCTAINSVQIRQLFSDQWDALDSALFELRSTIEILEIVSGHLDPKPRVNNAVVVLISNWRHDFEKYTKKLEQAFENHRELREAI